MRVDVNGTVNLALMQAQELTLILAATCFLGGIAFMVGACIVEALSRQQNG